MSLLAIRSLTVGVRGKTLLHDVSLEIEAGEIVALVGESGSGKSLTALAAIGLLPHGMSSSGAILFDGRNLAEADEETWCALRGDDIGMVFQEPMTALNPLKTIGSQIAEGIRQHTRASQAEAMRRAEAMLARVGLKDCPPSRYPHELSGGQRQRVVIAMACVLKPRLLIADEPTTALDVVVQAGILALLRELVAENGMSLLLISHDLAVVAGMADRIAVLKDGRIVEEGNAGLVLSAPGHAYTRGLAKASMHLPQTRPPEADAPVLLEVEKVSRRYPGRRLGLFSRAPDFKAVDDVSFTIRAGHSLALVGRSGCGKSTLARMILALDAPSGGAIRLGGEPHAPGDRKAMRPLRRRMGIVFQDPYGSFDPRMTVENLVAEPLYLLDEPLSASSRRDRVASALADVGLAAADMAKYPHEFSGGQRQRLSIARALINGPDLLVADEPVSALDVTIRAQILDLIAGLNARLKLTCLIITHDLHVARAIGSEVMVMDKGKIVERGAPETVFTDPQSQAARDLVAAAPRLLPVSGRG